MQSQSLRQERGQMIAKTEGSIKRVDEHEYQVKSQSHRGFYEVLSTEYGWACSCPDNQYRGIDCKHILGVQVSFSLRKTVEASVVIRPVNAQACPSCQSVRVVKHGIRHNDYGDIQQFICKDCRRTFVVNLGFERMHASPQTITSAMQLYFTGESLRNVQKFLSLQGVKVSHICVLKWIRKYVKLMDGYLDKVKPQVGDTWRTDELYIKVKGDQKYLFAMLDDETRFWIAQQVSANKGTSDVRPMFRRAIEVAEKKPKVLISDGANNFHEAWRKEMWSQYGEDVSPQHIREIQMDGQVHNNKMERMNGELRDREKVMRSLKTMDTPILKGMQIFHNYIRTHEGLEGKTPAEAAGITVEGQNRWLTIIQNASQKEQR